MTLDDMIENNQRYDSVLDAINKEEKKLEAKKAELDEFRLEILEEKKKQFYQLSKYSTFNTDSIGSIIAKLLTETENESYKYITSMIRAKKIAGYDYDSGKTDYIISEIPIKIIVKEEHAVYFEKIIDIKDFNSLLELNIPIIIVDRNEAGITPKNLNIYDYDLNLNLNAKFFKESAIHYFEMPNMDQTHYEIIKNYIDEVVSYRMQNGLKNITDKELENQLERHLKTNEKTLKKEKR